MKIMINSLPLPISEDKNIYPIVSIETVNNRCILRSPDKETLDEYKSIITTSSYSGSYSENDDYLLEALSSDYGQTISVVGRSGYTDATFANDSQQMRVSATFKYK